MCFLQEALSGKPATLIANVTVTAPGDFLAKAWQKLLSYYDNNKNIIYYYSNSLLNLQGMTKESLDQLSRVYNDIMDILDSLKSLQVNVSQADFILVPLTISLLDPVTQKEWEISQGNTISPATHTQLMQFLKIKLKALETVANTTSISSIKT